MINIHDETIIGAKVRQTFTNQKANRRYVRDDYITREQLLTTFAPDNLRSLIGSNFMELQHGDGGPKERFVIKEKDGYAVIEGRKINDKPLEREEALRLLAPSN